MLPGCVHAVVEPTPEVNPTVNLLAVANATPADPDAALVVRVEILGIATVAAVAPAAPSKDKAQVVETTVDVKLTWASADCA